MILFVGEQDKGWFVPETAGKEISTSTFKKHNYYYFILVMTKYVTNRNYVNRLNDLLKNQECPFMYYSLFQAFG